MIFFVLKIMNSAKQIQYNKLVFDSNNKFLQRHLIGPVKPFYWRTNFKTEQL